MYLKIFLHFIFWCGLLTIQLALLPNLPWGLSYLNAVLVGLVFSLIMLDWKWSIGWWLGVAWLLSLFSFFSFFGLVVVMVINFLILNSLLVNVFTNRSLYTMLFLVCLAVVVNDLGLYSFEYLTAIINGQQIIILDKGFWLLELKNIGANLILAIFVFYGLNFLSYSFRPIIAKGQSHEF